MSAQAYARKKEYPERKKKLYGRLVGLLENHKYIAVVSLYKLRSIQVKELRKKLSGKVEFYAIKNRLAVKALNSKGINALDEYIKGQTLLMFFDIDPFELNLELQKNQVYLPAKAGDIASDDIVVPEGNTGLQAGPALSEFKQFKIPTRIETGSIFVTKDTVVAKKGDVIDDKLAALLSKLGLKPIRSGLSIKAVYYEGKIIKGEDLALDLEAIKASVINGYQNAFKLAYALELPEPEVLQVLLAEHAAKARALALAAEVYDESTIKDIIADREAKAAKLRQLTPS